MAQESKPSQEEMGMEQHSQQANITTSRRSFLRKGLMVGGAGAIGAGLLANGLPVFAEERSSSLTKTRYGYSPVPVRSRNPGNRFLATIQRTGRRPGQRSPGGQWKSSLHQGS